MKTKQSGVTLLGFLMILLVAGFFAYMAMRLVPAYVEYGGVVKAMNGVAAGVAGKSPDEIRGELLKRMGVQYVSDSTVTPADITITQDNGGASLLSVSYDKDVPFMYNVDFLLHFSRSVPLQGSVGQ